MTPDVPPLPQAPLAYHDDAAAMQSWVRLVKALGVVAVVLASASIADYLLDLLPPLLGISRLLPFSRRLHLQMILNIAPTALLLAGGIACLALHPAGRRLMFWYAVASLGVALIYLVFSVGGSWVNVGSARGTRQTMGYAIYMVLGSVRGMGFPAAVLAVMVQPPVKRIFGR
jgi:hypothetical protein